MRKSQKSKKNKKIKLSFKLKRDSGLVSIFLAGILSLLLITILILTDFARLSIASNQMKTGLRLASNLALSGFDKNLAKEFGLFVLEDMNQAKQISEAAYKRRIEGGKDHSDLLRLTESQLELMPTEEARLSIPSEMEKQIISFMDWQTASLLFEKLSEELKAFKNLEELPVVIEAKIQYEKALDDIQQSIQARESDFSKAKELNPIFLFSEELEIFRGFPALNESFEKFKEETAMLDQSLKRAYEYSIQGREEEFERISEIFDSDTLSLLEGRFNLLKKAYEKNRENLNKAEQYAQFLYESLAALENPKNDLNQAKLNWNEALGKLPFGMMGISFQTELENKGVEEKFEQIEKLKYELGDIAKKGKNQIEDWNQIQLNGIDLSAMSFSDWLDSIDKKYALGEYLNSTLEKGSGEGSFEEEGLLSDESFNAEKDIIASSSSFREKLLEFVKAVKEKASLILRAGKANAEAKKAEKAGLSNLKGSIQDRINSDQLKRFNQDCPQKLLPSLLTVGLFDGSDKMMDQVIQSIKETGEFLKRVDAAEELSDHADLLLYWTQMFSCRTSKIREEETGKPVLSLTSYPMNSRPYFAGELEYILYGEDQWMDNITRASNRIFAIRLLSNLSYALTSNEILGETQATAMAIAGWSGFAMPIIQSVFIFLLALGESWLDLIDLHSGKRVALYKSQESWRFSLSGLQNLATDISQDLFDDLRAASEAGLEEAKKMAVEKVKSIQLIAEEMVISALKNPLRNFLVEELIRYEPKKRDQASQSFDLMIEAMSKQCGDQGLAGLMNEALRELQEEKDYLMRQIDQLYQKKMENGLETEEISKKIEEISQHMAEKAGEVVIREIDQICTKSINKANTFLEKEEDKLNQEIAEWLKAFKKDMGDQGLDGSMALSSAISMSYEDYISLLLFIRSCGPEKENMLSNTSKLIQAENSNPIDLTRAPTSLKWEGKARVNTTFIGRFQSSFISDFGKSSYMIKENWEEGYEKYREKDKKKNEISP